MRALPYVIPIGLAIYALIDLWRSRPVERGGLHPFAWVLIILVPVLGPITWLAVSRYLRSGSGGAGDAARPTGPRRPVPPRRRGPVAPDDDPEFLWRLERDARRQRGRTGDDAGADADDTNG